MRFQERGSVGACLAGGSRLVGLELGMGRLQGRLQPVPLYQWIGVEMIVDWRKRPFEVVKYTGSDPGGQRQA